MKFTPSGRPFLWAALLVSAIISLPLSAASSDDFPPLAKADFAPAALGPREPELRVDFPGAAAARGVPKGSAVVAVLVDADGRAADFQLIGYTDKAFGTALLEHARMLAYQPAKFKGARVPARYDVGYRFESASTALNPLEASRQKFNQAGGKLTYSAVPESRLDAPLEFTNASLPRVPAGYSASGDKPVNVSVTFYVDEEGKVHVPSVQSADSPKLFAPAIHAVMQWSFKPPMAGGKPALVYAGRSVVFLAQAETPAAPAQ